MRDLDMRCVRCIALFLLLAASGGPVRTPASAQPASSSDASAASGGQDRLVRISRFDCVMPDDVADNAEFPWPKGLSRWSGGGPGGAAWNAGALRCAVEFQTSCIQGEADIELRIGGALSGARHAKIDRGGAHLVTIDLKAGQWEKHFDQGSSLTKRFPYRTATFSASVTASCQAPEAFGPGMGPRLEFADHGHFTAGFAKGE
jgi:hypothetical protein